MLKVLLLYRLTFRKPLHSLCIIVLFFQADFFSFGQNPEVRKYGKKEGVIASRYIFHLLEDSKGYLWGASQVGVFRYNGRTFEYFGANDGLPDPMSLRIVTDPNDRLWVQSFSGEFARFDGNSFMPYTYNELVSPLGRKDFVWHFQVDRKNTLYLGTNKRGLWKIDAQGVLSNPIPAINKWKGLGIWFSDSLPPVVFGLMDTLDRAQLKEALHVFDAQFRHVRTIPLELPRNKPDYRSFYTQCRDGTIVLSFGHHLYRLTTDGLIEQTRQPTMINSICEDTEGNIWVATIDSGVVYYPGGRLNSGKEIRYFSGTTFNWVRQDHEQGIWLTARGDGMWYLPNVSRDAASKVPPLVHMTGLRINDRDTSILSHYELSHERNTFSISYTGVSFQVPKITFYHRLKGVDTEWKRSDQGTIQYVRLPPGKYRFDVYALTEEGTPSARPASFSFTIEAPFWGTWWFRSLAVIALLSLITAGYQWWYRRLNAKREMEQQLIRLESKALRAQINPHFIFNVLMAIQDYVSRGDAAASEVYLVKFSRLIRLILETSREGFIMLLHELEILENYLEMERMRFKNQFGYSIDVQANIDPERVFLPPMLIQPYLENAILHGVGSKNEGGFITLTFDLEQNDRLRCTITDNGIGWKQTSSIRPNHQPLGLLITRERLQLLNHSFDKQFDIEVIDLGTLDASTSGTRVVIYIPVLQNQKPVRTYANADH